MHLTTRLDEVRRGADPVSARVRARHTARRFWAQADTFAALADLTALYLEGAVDRSPTHCGPPDPETASIRDRLAVLNRTGLVVTYGSQPGEIDEYGRQRAFVEAFCAGVTTDDVDAACGEAGLEVLCRPPGSRPPRNPLAWPSIVTVPVTEGADGYVYTDVGGWLSPSEVETFHRRAGCRRPVVDALLACWQVSVVDPEWGRNDLLWDTLAVALGVPGGAE